MAKGDRWIKFGVYRRKGDAQSAASRIRRDNAFARVTKVKSDQSARTTVQLGGING